MPTLIVLSVSYLCARCERNHSHDSPQFFQPQRLFYISLDLVKPLIRIEPHAIIMFMQENNKPLAHIIIGFIGSGKTTFARKLEKETGAIRFTKDEWMVRLFGNTPPKDKFEEYDNKMASLATDMALKCLKAGISVIIDEGFWVKEQRDEIREKVKNVGAIPKIYYLEVPFEIMKARTLKRSENPPVDSFNIDEESFNQYWKFFQPPDKDEEFTLVNQANSNKE